MSKQFCILPDNIFNLFKARNQGSGSKSVNLYDLLKNAILASWIVGMLLLNSYKPLRSSMILFSLPVWILTQKQAFTSLMLKTAEDNEIHKYIRKTVYISASILMIYLHMFMLLTTEQVPWFDIFEGCLKLMGSTAVIYLLQNPLQRRLSTPINMILTMLSSSYYSLQTKYFSFPLFFIASMIISTLVLQFMQSNSYSDKNYLQEMLNYKQFSIKSEQVLQIAVIWCICLLLLY